MVFQSLPDKHSCMSKDISNETQRVNSKCGEGKVKTVMKMGRGSPMEDKNGFVDAVIGQLAIRSVDVVVTGMVKVRRENSLPVHGNEKMLCVMHKQ